MKRDVDDELDAALTAAAAATRVIAWRKLPWGRHKVLVRIEFSWVWSSSTWTDQALAHVPHVPCLFFGGRDLWKNTFASGRDMRFFCLFPDSSSLPTSRPTLNLAPPSSQGMTKSVPFHCLSLIPGCSPCLDSTRLSISRILSYHFGRTKPR